MVRRGCEIRSVTQGKNVDQGCSENRVPRRICGVATEENLPPLTSLQMCLGPQLTEVFWWVCYLDEADE